MSHLNLIAEELPLLHITSRPSVIMTEGSGMYLRDAQQRTYLDFASGWAVNSLGHSPAVLQKAISEQAAKLVHASPAFYSDVLLQFATELTKEAGMDKVFFASSGAEANESAIKLARKYGQLYLKGANEIITLENSFHGRTLATMSATGKKHWKPLFEPKAGGFTHVPTNNIDALTKAITKRTCAVMVEPIQGEGGIRELTEDYVLALRELCNKHRLLLIFDEIQTGMGRTGAMFAFQHWNIVPDILTLGKGIGSGFPLSAMLTRKHFDLFEAGEQGGTYCGSALACAAGLAVLREIKQQNLPYHADQMGRLIKQGLKQLVTSTNAPISNIRGKGLLLAFTMPTGTAPQLASLCLEEGLIINAPNPSTIRLCPALIIETDHINKMLAIVQTSLGKLNFGQ